MQHVITALHELLVFCTAHASLASLSSLTAEAEPEIPSTAYNNIAASTGTESLIHSLKHKTGITTASVEGACDVLLKLTRKYFRARRPQHLILNSMNCSVCTAH